MKRFLFERRMNRLDGVAIATAAVLMANDVWLLAGALILLGGLLSVWGERSLAADRRAWPKGWVRCWEPVE